MAKISRQVGSTSHVLTLFIQDATSTTGAGLTGLTFNAAGLACYYKRNRGTASVAVTLASITTLGTYVSGGFKEIDVTNMPGFYEFHAPDAAMLTGAGSVAFVLRGAANMLPCTLEIELTATNNQDATAGGMANVDAAVSSRLPTSGYTAPSNPTDYQQRGVAVTLPFAAGLAALAGSTATSFQFAVPAGTPVANFIGRKLYHFASLCDSAILTASLSGTTATVTVAAGAFPTPTTGDLIAITG